MTHTKIKHNHNIRSTIKLAGITAGRPAPSSIPVPDLQLTHDPLTQICSPNHSKGENHALIQLKSSSKLLSHEKIPYTWNYWRVEYLAIHSKNSVGEILIWRF